MGAIGSRGIHPAQPLLNNRDDAAQHLAVIHPLPTPFLGKGWMPSTCSALSPNNWAITHLLLVLSWGSLSAQRVRTHNQKMAVAARRMAERKTWAQPS